MTEYFEEGKAGPRIKAHRTALGIQLSDLIDAAGPGSETILRHAERAERPALKVIEAHHTALMIAYAAGAGTGATPLARREQWYATELDAILWHRAMEARPQIAWWWGVRSDNTPRGAFCYVCEQMIHGYDVGRGLTRRARAAVMLHRLTHINEMTATAAAPKKGSAT